MKKIISCLILLIALVSCWKEATIDWLQIVDHTNFSVQIPQNWEILEKDDSRLPSIQNWSIELAWVSDNIKYGFSSNIIILWQKVNKIISSKDFSMTNYVWSTGEYKEFTKIDSEDFTFSDNDTSLLYTFEAKYNNESPKLKFLQVWKICNVSSWYLITIAFPTDIKNTSAYKEFLQTFKCK